MGGSGIAADTREAASALRWWLEMGVDAATQEDPRNWLDGEGPAIPGAAPAPNATDAPQEPAKLPATLDAFQAW